MYVELIVDPGMDIWYGLPEVEIPEAEEIEYEEPEFKRRTRGICKSDFKVRQ